MSMPPAAAGPSNEGLVVATTPLMNSLRWMWIVFAVVGLAAGAAFAALPDDYDQHPLPDDLVLPMPNGARMVFRPVVLGSGTQRATREYGMGDRTGQHGKEPLRRASVGGSFIVENDGHKDWLFYIGKYVVTEAQFAAVCAAPVKQQELAPRSRFPETNLTRSEMDNFVDEYNAWLLKNTPDQLPEYAGALGFLRLPTEEEWEFAARGGSAATAEPFDAATPYAGDLQRYEWFAGSRSSFGKLKEVGLLDPNPLGLYDVLGDVAEMTDSMYQFAGRTGGYTVRGGSFRTPEEDIRASLRTEQPRFGRDNQPMREETVGFRLVIASQVITDQNQREMDAETNKQPVDAADNGSPMPPEAKALMSTIAKRLQVIEDRRSAISLANDIAVAPGSQVRVVRSETMFFLKAASRAAVPGEEFTVLRQDLTAKRLYVLATDAQGDAIALNIAQDACGLVPRGAEVIFGEALTALRTGNAASGLALLQQAASLNGAESLYADTRDAFQGFYRALRDRDAANAAKLNAQQIALQKQRNAAVVDRPNLLFPNDRGNQQRATGIRREADFILKSAVNGSKEAEATLSQAVATLQSLGTQQAHDGAYDIALATQRCLAVSGFEMPYGRQQWEHSGESGGNTADNDDSRLPSFAEMPGLIAKAESTCASASQAVQERRLYAGRKLIESGLKAMPGDRVLRSLRSEVDEDIGLTEQAATLAAKLETDSAIDNALALTKRARLLCSDSSDLDELNKRLTGD